MNANYLNRVRGRVWQGKKRMIDDIYDSIEDQRSQNTFDKYYFIYKNSTGTWNLAANPVFIAEHACCRAVLKSEVQNIDEYLRTLNDIKQKDTE